MAKKILIIVHQQRSTPGRIGRLLRERGFELDIRRVVLGDPLPETLEGYKGTIIFGGPMSANDVDEVEGIGEETEWLKVPLAEEVPFLGVCLGAQILARHLGARVTFHPEERAEIGYYPITATKEGVDLFGPWPSHVYQWHREGFDLPHGARLLARGDNHFPNQAYIYGRNAVGIQFHPEVTLAMIHRWTTLAHERFVLPGVRPRATHFKDRLVYDDAVEAWLNRLLDRWLANDFPNVQAPATTLQSAAGS